MSAKYQVEVLPRSNTFILVFYEQSDEANKEERIPSIGSIKLEDHKEVVRWQKMIQKLNEE